MVELKPKGAEKRTPYWYDHTTLKDSHGHPYTY